MTRQLLHVPTNTVYDWNPDFAKRGDFRELPAEPEPVEEVKPAGMRRRRANAVQSAAEAALSRDAAKGLAAKGLA